MTTLTTLVIKHQNNLNARSDWRKAVVESSLDYDGDTEYYHACNLRDSKKAIDAFLRFNTTHIS